MERPIFLKLGGSLITEKGRPFTSRPELLHRLGATIARVRAKIPELQLLLGHGSGSFGHIPAKEFGTRQGVWTKNQWQGYAEVWFQASTLNRLVIDALHHHQLPAVSFPPSAAVIAAHGEVISWNLTPLRTALEAGLLPVIHGDVVTDTQLGGTILSTEDLFVHLAQHLLPERILLAGLEPGVWADYPACTRLWAEINPNDNDALVAGLHGAEEIDVTGGMADKVRQMLSLIEELPDLTILIFSGKDPDLVAQVMLGGSSGTLLRTKR